MSVMIVVMPLIKFDLAALKPDRSGRPNKAIRIGAMAMIVMDRNRRTAHLLNLNRLRAVIVSPIAFNRALQDDYTCRRLFTSDAVNLTMMTVAMASRRHRCDCHRSSDSPKSEHR